MKRTILLLLLLFCLPGTMLMAQDAGISVWDDPMVMFYTVVAFIFITVLLILAVAVYLLQVLNFLVQQQAKDRALKLGIEYVREPGIWERLNAWLWDIAPIEKEKDIMMHHEYDGIRELDNHLPPWWRWLLYITIIFAVVYMVMYHITDSLPMQEEEYATELALADAEMKK